MAPGTDAWAHGDGHCARVVHGTQLRRRSPSLFTYLHGAVDKAPVAKWVMDNLLVEHIDIDKYIHNGATELYVQRRARVASRVERRLARFAQANGPFAPADDLTDAL